jgi:AraC-like DNA-binding protein
LLEPFFIAHPTAGRAERLALGFTGRAEEQEAGDEPAGTFTRRFQRETGLSFVAWRQQASLFACLPRLADGVSVTEVAMLAGYDNVAAFTTMFRRRLGTAPRNYMKASPGR